HLPTHPPPYPYTTLFRSHHPTIYLRQHYVETIQRCVRTITVTVYINHHSPQKYLDLTIRLVQGGIAGQNTASLAAEWIINNRVRSEEHTSELQSRFDLV